MSGTDLFEEVTPLPEQGDITLEEARARHPGCHIVAVRFGGAIGDEYPHGAWCLLAVPEAKLIEAVEKSMPGWLGWFAATRPTSIRITPPVPASA